MGNGNQTERVIDLKDLLHTVTKKWRKILVGAVIIGLLTALYQGYSGLRVLLDSEELAALREKYEIALADYDATGERLRTTIADLREQSERQQEYNSKSELMAIDPMNKWEGSIQLYIDSLYQVNPGMSFQNIDLSNRLVWAYSSYLQSGELLSEIVQQTDAIDEIRFLSEIYNVSANNNTATIEIHCIGKSEADVIALLDLLKQKTEDRYGDIRDAIGDHSCRILTESVFSTIDLKLDAQQKANESAIPDYATSIAQANEQLTKWENSQKPQPEYGGRYTLKQAAKYLILGGVIGLVVMFCCLAAGYILSVTVKTDADWRYYNTPVLGHIGSDGERKHFRWLDRAIDRLFLRTRSTSAAQDCTLVARNLSAALQKQGIGEAWFVGRIDRAAAEDLMRKMAAAAPEIVFSYAGDILSEPEAVGNLKGTDKLILLGLNQKTALADIEQMLTLLRAWGKTVLGVVSLE